jgi:hypothetical protein
LFISSLWGKFGPRSNLPKTTYIKDQAMYFDILTSDGQEVQDVSFVNDEMVRLQWVNKLIFVFDANFAMSLDS